MADNLDVLNTAVSLLIRAVLLAARFSGRVRRRSPKRLAARDVDTNAKEILFLKDRVYQLEMQVSILQKRLHKKGKKPRYEVRERLPILWHMEAFQIPRRKVFRHFGIARSTLYRWLHKIEDQESAGTPANKTPTEIASPVWEITRANHSWGRLRVANQLKLLGIFLGASTVRNILQRPKPPNTHASAAPAEKAKEEAETRSVPASYPIMSGRSTRQKSCAGACGPSTSWWPSTTSPARWCASLLWKGLTPGGLSRLWNRLCKSTGHRNTSSPTKPLSLPERRSPNCYGSGTSNRASGPWGRADLSRLQNASSRHSSTSGSAACRYQGLGPFDVPLHRIRALVQRLAAAYDFGKLPAR
jgi:transposase